jgi:hypothetical protein
VTVDEIIACLGTRPHPEDQLGAPCSVQTTLLTVLLTARQASWSRTSNAIIRPDTSCNIESWGGRGRVLRASISFVVIGFAASINAAAAQYLPPQSPPAGYPPPAYYPYRGYPPPAYYGYRGYPPPAYYRANPSAPFQGADQTQTGRRTMMNMTGLTPHNQGLALRQVVSDRSR